MYLCVEQVGWSTTASPAEADMRKLDDFWKWKLDQAKYGYTFHVQSAIKDKHHVELMLNVE